MGSEYKLRFIFELSLPDGAYEGDLLNCGEQRNSFIAAATNYSYYLAHMRVGLLAVV